MIELLKDNTVVMHMVAGTWSVAFSTALTYPLDTIIVLKQVTADPRKKKTTGELLRRVQAVSGNAGMYNGVGWLTVGSVLGVGTRFGIYELLTSYYKDGRGVNFLWGHEAFMAGMAAGAVESLITTPFELIKLRAQVSSAFRSSQTASDIKGIGVSPSIGRLLRGYSPDIRVLNFSVALLSVLTKRRQPNLGDAIKEYPWMMTGSGSPPSVYHVRRPLDLISFEGWSALWKGLRSAMVRNSVFSGIFFSSWQLLHEAMLAWKAVGMTPVPRYDEEIGPLHPLAVSFAAGLSGSVAAAASHPFDTAKSRSQCAVDPKYLSMERKFMKWKVTGKKWQRWTGIHPSDNRKVLYRGVFSRMTRSGVGSFLLLQTYFLAVDMVSS